MDGEGRNEAGALDSARVAPIVLITGASGFVGAALAAALQGAARVRTAGRAAQPEVPAHYMVGDLSSATDWRAALDGVSAVVHAAGPAHASFPPQELRRGIVDGSATLARQAAEAGVSRFIYVSSIRACVSRTFAAPANEDSPADPQDAYGRAKREAELAILAETSMRPVALRPPLVIGAHAKANLAKLMRLLDTPLPLPFAGIRNRRSFVSLASLAEAVGLVLQAERNPAAGVFHIADQPSVSTGEMAALLRRGMGRPPRLFSAPGMALAPSALTQSLQVDDARLRETFGYRGQDAREALVACGKAWAAQ